MWGKAFLAYPVRHGVLHIGSRQHRRLEPVRQECLPAHLPDFQKFSPDRYDLEGAKKLLAEAMLDNAMLKDINSKNV